MLSKITSWRHSKIIAFALAVAVFLTAFYGLNPVFSLVGAESTTGETATVDIWDGTTPSFADAFGDQIQAGKGTSTETPYEITTGAQLYAALHSDADSFEKYFVVLKDIQLQTDENLEILRDFIAESKNGTSSIDLSGLTKWPATASASGAKSFRGTIDGNHHSITGLYMYSGAQAWGTATGLIDRVQEPTTVKNIILDSAYVSGASYVGGLIGASYGSRAETTISGCTVKNSKIANITGETVEGYASAGGLIGGGINVGKVTTIDKCVVADTQVTNAVKPELRGGMVGYMYGSGGYAVKDSICVGDNISSYYGIFRADLSSNSYAATNAVGLPGVTLLTDTHKGGTAYEAMGFIPSKGWIVEDENSCPMYVGVEKAKNSDYVAPVWNGNTALTVSDLAGKGTVDEPYLISTGSELYFAAHSHDDGANKYFEIINDIQLQTDENLELLRQFISESKTDASAVVPTGLNEWYTVYTKDIRFKGVLNGNFHTITGLYKSAVSIETDRGVGFINDLTNVSAVKNIIFDAAYVTGNRYAGVVAGTVRGGDGIPIEGCSVINSRVYNTAASNTYGYDSTSGIVGAGYNTGSVVFNNCSVYNTTLTNKTGNLIGGIYGNNWSTTTGRTPPTITNCVVEGYPVALVTCSGYVNTYTDTEGSIGANNSTNATLLSDAASMKGAIAYDNMPGITPAHGWVAIDGSYPMYVGKENVKDYEYDAPVWNGKKLTLSNLAGKGTVDEPYLISTGSELSAAVRNETEGLVFSIMNDIYLNTADSTNNWNLWSSYKVFNGTINGNGHTIYNMKEFFNDDINNSTAAGNGVSVALIPAAKNATVNNLHIRGSVMAEVWNTHAAALLGVVKTDGTASINGCSVDDSTVSATRRVSSFVARIEEGATANIENCVSGAGNVFMQSGDSPFVSGGFVGLNSGTANLNNCISAGQGLSAEGDGDVIVGENVFTNVANFKEALISGEATISDAFYYDYLSDNAPMLKNRLATQDKDIDGDEGAELDEADAVALKNILLYGSDAQLTLSEGNTKGYNDLAGVDITDLVYLSK